MQNPMTVTQLTQAIKLCLESGFPNVWIQGEISNCKCQTSGHLYFSLKDAQAQISAIMFRADAALLPVQPKDGNQVLVRGELNVYPASGKYQLVVRELQQVGLGALLLKLEELKQKIHKKGWFRKEHKKPLPKFPKRIGVVTSPTGAAIQDILNILKRRFSGFSLLLNPVKVQGEGAAQEIAEAIKQFNQYNLVDVMIVGRGGGSMEDLWAFNEEIVAEAIFHSKIPIISAVGHEIDHCIADYVADVRAPTPSAAAEIVIAEKAHQLQHLAQTKQRLQQTVYQLIRHDRRRLEGAIRQPIFQAATRLLGPWMQRLDHVREDIDTGLRQIMMQYKLRLNAHAQLLKSLKPDTQISHLRQKVQQLEKGITQSMQHILTVKRRQLNRDERFRHLDQKMEAQLQQKKVKLESIWGILHAVDPKNLLLKGYSILFSEKDGSVITSVCELQKQQEIRLMLSDGDALSTVKEIFPKR